MALFHERWPWRRNREGRTLPELMPRWLRLGLGLLLVLVAAAGLVVRGAGDDPARWHADPFEGARTGRPNDFLAGPAGMPGAPDRVLAPLAGAPAAVLARLHAAALAEPRTRVVAGSPEALHVTYVQRSALWGFPDYVSVRAEAVEGGTALALWSRSRFGHSDLGVNRARGERWLAALAGG